MKIYAVLVYDINNTVELFLSLLNMHFFLVTKKHMQSQSLYILILPFHKTYVYRFIFLKLNHTKLCTMLMYIFE